MQLPQLGKAVTLGLLFSISTFGFAQEPATEATGESAPPAAVSDGSSEPGATQTINDYEVGVRLFAEDYDRLATEVSYPRHLPRYYFKGTKTKYAVVVLPGLFEGPNYIAGITKLFGDQGYNTFSVLYAGHWRKSSATAIEKARAEDWVRERDRAIEIARHLGDQVILVGYSLGGLLAVDAALNPRSDIAGLFIISPSLVLSPGAGLGTAIGSLVGLNGNSFVGMQPDGFDSPFYSSKAGNQVQRLINRMVSTYGGGESSGSRHWMYETIKVPTFVAYSDDDNATWTWDTQSLYDALTGAKELVRYRSNTRVNHQTIAKMPGDGFGADPRTAMGQMGGSAYGINPYWNQFANSLRDFAKRNFAQ